LTLDNATKEAEDITFSKKRMKGKYLKSKIPKYLNKSILDASGKNGSALLR